MKKLSSHFLTIAFFTVLASLVSCGKETSYTVPKQINTTPIDSAANPKDSAITTPKDTTKPKDSTVVNPTPPTPTNKYNTDCSKLPFRVGSVLVVKNQNGQEDARRVIKDTMYNNLKYMVIENKLQDGSNRIVNTYWAIDNDRQVHLYAPSMLPNAVAINTINYKLNKPVGETWSIDISPPEAAGIVSYAYKFEILSNTESVTFDGQKFSNGQKVKLSLVMTATGMPEYTIFESISTYYCGLGFFRGDGTKYLGGNNEQVVEELVKLTY